MNKPVDIKIEQQLYRLFEVSANTRPLFNPITLTNDYPKPYITSVKLKKNQLNVDLVYKYLEGHQAGIYIFDMPNYTAKVYWWGIDYISTTATKPETVFANYRDEEPDDDADE